MLLPPGFDDHPATRAFRDAIAAARLWRSFAQDDPEEHLSRDRRVDELIRLAEDAVPELVLRFPAEPGP